MNHELFCKLNETKENNDPLCSSEQDVTGCRLSDALDDALRPYRGMDGQYQKPTDQMAEAIGDLLHIIRLHKIVPEHVPGEPATTPQMILEFARQSIRNYQATR